MADGTKIEWTDATWNPITGCSVVSPGCTNCYAMKLAGTRLKHHPSRMGLTRDTKAGPVWTGEVSFNAEWLDQPLRWTKPRMIFVCAHGDLFAEGVPDEWIDQVFAVMALCPQHTFQVLTKRPERMREYLAEWRQFRVAEAALQVGRNLPDSYPGWSLDHWKPSATRGCSAPAIWPLPNVWLGVSVEDQRRADERIPILLDTPAAIRWISAEPLLGPVDLTDACHGSWFFDALRGTRWHDDPDGPNQAEQFARGLDWVVAGGESGPGARPMHPDWARSLRDQCATAGVPFLFKQWGEWTEACQDLRNADDSHIEIDPDSHEAGEIYDRTNDRLIAADGRLFTPETLPPDTPARLIERLGKRRAGRLLDGVEHNGYPELRHA